MLDVRTTIWSVDAPPVSGFSPVSPPEYSNSISNSSSSSKDSLVKSKEISNLVATSLESVTVFD